MRVCFLDASAAIKRYLQETGSEWIQALCRDQATFLVIASLTWAEVASGICRKARLGDLSPAIRDLKLAEFHRHWRREYIRVHPQPPVLAGAVRLLTRHPLKASDAVQLASALAARHAFPGPRRDFRFVSADARLLEAARRSGLTTANPMDYS